MIISVRGARTLPCSFQKQGSVVRFRPPWARPHLNWVKTLPRGRDWREGIFHAGVNLPWGKGVFNQGEGEFPGFFCFFSRGKVPKEQKGSPAGGAKRGPPQTENRSLNLPFIYPRTSNIPPVNFPRGMNRLCPSRNH